MKNERKERFNRVAAKRVEKILYYLNLLGNCSNPHNYEYGKEEVDKMFREIQKAVSIAKKRFEIELSKNNKNFNF